MSKYFKFMVVALVAFSTTACWEKKSEEAAAPAEMEQPAAETEMQGDMPADAPADDAAEQEIPEN